MISRPRRSRDSLQGNPIAPSLFASVIVTARRASAVGLVVATAAAFTVVALPWDAPSGGAIANVITAPNSAETAFRPSDSAIAFVRSDGDTADIFVMDADGGNQVRLTNNEWVDDIPAWSPDGTKIAFVSGRDTNAALYVMDADGNDVVLLAHSLISEFSPAWSPDGTKIAFENDRQINVIDLESGNQSFLASGRNPLWSPDGSKFAFQRLSGGNNDDIYVMKADGSEAAKLTDSEGFAWDPAWSPDGSEIAFRRYPSDIDIMNVDGGGTTNLTSSPASWRWDPAWSPDGTKIAFTSAEDIIDGPFDIYTVDVDGGKERRLTKSASKDERPAWSPDGTKIAFESDRDGNPEIYVMDADGSNQTRLTDNPKLDQSPSWQPVVKLEPTPAPVGMPSTGGVAVSDGAFPGGLSMVLAGGVVLILGALVAILVLASSGWRLRRINDNGLSSPANSPRVNRRGRRSLY